MRNPALLIFFFSMAFNLSAQSDSAVAKPASYADTQYDSLRLVKLNNSGNLMIAAGVGLCGAGSYLIYQGFKVYGTSPTSADPAIQQKETERNHRQGTIYYVAGGIAIAGGIVLTALGARNKINFKREKKMMSLQSGILDNGNLGVALNF